MQRTHPFTTLPKPSGSERAKSKPRSRPPLKSPPHRAISTTKPKPAQPSYLIRDFPTTSTKFAIKQRLKDGEGNFVPGKVLPPPREAEVSPTTWDFRSLHEGSFMDVKETTKEQAAKDSIRDASGNVAGNLDNLAQFDEPTLMQIALGVGEFKPTKPQKSPADDKQSMAVAMLKKKTLRGDESKRGQSMAIELDAEGDDVDPLAALKTQGTRSHAYAGFTDPVPLPTYITTPLLQNLQAARVLGVKLIARANNLDSESTDERLPSHQRQSLQSQSRQFREQALLWFARASHGGDVDSTSQLTQHFEEEVAKVLGLDDDIDPVLQDKAVQEYIRKVTEHSTGPHQDEPDDGESQTNDGQFRFLTPSIKLQIEIMYEEVTKALLPRLQGKQLEGVDYRTMHPFISNLFYFETLVDQSSDPDALLAYCEWMFGMDALFTQIIEAGGADDQVTAIKQNEHVTTTESFIGGYLQAYLKPLTLHRHHGEVASALLESLNNTTSNGRI